MFAWITSQNTAPVDVLILLCNCNHEMHVHFSFSPTLPITTDDCFSAAWIRPLDCRPILAPVSPDLTAGHCTSDRRIYILRFYCISTTHIACLVFAAEACARWIEIDTRQCLQITDNHWRWDWGDGERLVLISGRSTATALCRHHLLRHV